MIGLIKPSVMVKRNKYSLVVNRPQELKGGSNLLLRPIGLHNRADNCKPDALGADIVGRRDHSNVNVYMLRLNMLN